MSRSERGAERALHARHAPTGLRSWLRVNALYSTVSGTATILSASRIDSLLGLGYPGLVRLGGVGLVAFGADLVLLARARTSRLLRGAAVVVVADVGWVFGTAVLVASGLVDGRGRALLVAVAVPVGALAAAQWRALSAAGAGAAAGAGPTSVEASVR